VGVAGSVGVDDGVIERVEVSLGVGVGVFVEVAVPVLVGVLVAEHYWTSGIDLPDFPFIQAID